MITGNATEKGMLPVAHNACKIPTDAEELCIIAVNIAPAIIPNIGFENMVMNCPNSGISAKGATVPLFDLYLSSFPDFLKKYLNFCANTFFTIQHQFCIMLCNNMLYNRKSKSRSTS